MENKDQAINSNEEAIVTPLEYLEQQLKQEIEAKEVLPGKFQECTYHEGHLNQPVYVCLTCEKEDSREIKEKAGICYSCSIGCHSKHELLELFNKRNFRCECGTKKFQNKCNLEKFIPPQEGEVIHGDVDKKGWRKKVEGNIYTENFDGIYCWCKRNYSPETETDDMFECIDCQNWFHQRCIGINEIDDDDEFICCDCTIKHPILFSYLKTRKLCSFKKNENIVVNKKTDIKVENTIDNKEDNDNDNDNKSEIKDNEVINENDKKENNNSEVIKDETTNDMIDKQMNLKEVEIKTVLGNTTEDKKDEDDNKDIIEDEDNKEDNKEDSIEQKDTKENKRVREEKIEDQEDLNSNKEVKDENINQNNKVRKIDGNKNVTFCRKPDILPQSQPIHLLAKDGWRRIFCKCEECLLIYKDQDMEHLIDEEEEYLIEEEERDEENEIVETLYDAGMKALSSLPRSQAVQITDHVDIIRAKIKEFIAPFAQSGKIVTKEDVMNFFNQNK